MPWVIKEERTGKFFCGLGGDGKVDWDKEERCAWSFGHKSLTKKYLKLLRGKGLSVGAFGYTVRPKKAKEEIGMTTATKRGSSPAPLQVHGGGKCKVCNKKRNKMFAVEAFDPHEWVLVCWDCTHQILTEYLSEENQ